MSIEFVIIARAFIAMFIAGIGATFAVSIKKISHFALCAMISLAAGALLAVVVVDILPEASEMVGIIELALGFLSGYVIFYLVSKYVYHICPACAATHTEERFLSVNYLMIAAISLHSMMDGIGIAVSSQSRNENTSMMILLAVSIHKFPEGLALASVARGAGYSRRKAFAVALAVESTTFIGGIVSLTFFGHLATFWYGILLAHIGGGFFYITAHAMLGEMVKHERKNILAYAVFGFILVTLVSLLYGVSGV